MSTAYNPGAAFQGAQTPDFAQNMQNSALNGIKIGQQLATFSALRGMNMNDPASMDNGIQALIHAGAIDQAGAALNLGYQRYAIQARQSALAGLTGDFARIQSGQSSDMDQGQAQPDQTQAPAQPSPDQVAHMKAVVTFGKQSADEMAGVVALGDPTKTQQAADQIRQQGAQLGIPQSFLANALTITGDQATDQQHFQSLSDNYGAWLQHPTFGGNMQGNQPDLHPTTVTSSRDLLNDPGVQQHIALLAATGVDTSKIVEAMTKGLYTGTAAPGNVVVNNGVVSAQVPYAPEQVSAGNILVNPNEPQGQNTIAGAPQFVKTAPGERPGAFNPAGPQAQPPSGAAAPQPATAPNAKQSGAPYVNGGATTLTPATAALVPITVQGANSIRVNAGIVPQVEALLKDLREAGAPVGNLVGADDHSLDVAGTNTTSAHKVGLAFDDKAGAAWLAAHPQQAREIAAANGARWGGDFKDVGPDPEHFTWSKVPGVQGGTVTWNPKTGVFGGPSAQQGAAQPEGNTGVPGLTMGSAVPAFGPPTNVSGIPGKVQVQATGQISPVANTAPSAGDVFGLRGKTMDSQEYKAAQAGLSAWQALKAIAPQMTGPAAYTILDNFARAINPPGMARPTTIRAIVDQLGLPNQVAGFIEGAAGQGALTPQARQQIMDAVYENVVAHYDQAKQQNDYNSDYVKRHPEYGVQAQDVVAPLAPRPNRFLLVAPPAADRVKGQVYDTPKGPHVWTGTGWQTAQQ